MRVSCSCVPVCSLQDSSLEQQLVTAGADPQQAKGTIAAFQAAGAGTSRHLRQDLAAMVTQAVLEMQAGLDLCRSETQCCLAAAGGVSSCRWGPCKFPTCFSCSPSAAAPEQY